MGNLLVFTYTLWKPKWLQVGALQIVTKWQIRIDSNYNKNKRTSE